MWEGEEMIEKGLKGRICLGNCFQGLWIFRKRRWFYQKEGGRR